MAASESEDHGERGRCASSSSSASEGVDESDEDDAELENGDGDLSTSLSDDGERRGDVRACAAPRADADVPARQCRGYKVTEK